jgi:hypothetical protein
VKHSSLIYRYEATAREGSRFASSEHKSGEAEAYRFRERTFFTQKQVIWYKWRNKAPEVLAMSAPGKGGCLSG